jgi:hypothetical protein
MVHPSVNLRMRLPSDPGLVILSFPLDPHSPTEEDDASGGETETTCGQPMIQQYVVNSFRTKKALIGSRMREPGIEELKSLKNVNLTTACKEAVAAAGE